MPAKIRLARHGKKKTPYYHIVIADARAPRDGKYIEQIGTYNPITNPATIKINFDKALQWLENGAVPTETCRAILSYTGVYMKKHLLEGVKKGAFDETVAETRFNEWKKQNLHKIEEKKNRLNKESVAYLNARIEAESKVKDTRAEVIAKKLAQAAAKERAAKEAAKETPSEVVPVAETAKQTPSEVTTATETIKETPSEVVPVAETAKQTPSEVTTATETIKETPSEVAPTENKPDA